MTVTSVMLRMLVISNVGKGVAKLRVVLQLIFIANAIN